MALIKLTPYTDMTGLDEESGTIIVKDSDLRGVTFKDGNTVFSFFDCRFRKLVIENDQDIRFKDISICFFNCIIGDIQVSNIKSENISLGFYGTIVSGRIKNKNLVGVEFNNCLIPSVMFTIDVPKVNISYTKDSIEANHWQSVMLKFRLTDADAMQANPIKYSINGPKNVNITSNFEPEAERFKPTINLSYEPGVDHSETRIAGMSLQALTISGDPAGNISVENTRINSWYIYNFSPHGSVSFNLISPINILSEDARIGMHNSKLDGVEFDNITFDQYPIISFYRTKFSKAIFTSCDFPEDYKTFSRFVPIENVHYPDKKFRNYDKAQYEIFLQLKKAVEDTGNYYESQKLQGMAHDALRQIKRISWADRKILAVNSWSNDHGLSIKRPFIGFFICSIPLYILYLLSIGRIFNSSEFDGNLIGYYFSFIDITHRSDFLVENKKELSGWALTVDYAGKLFVGFFIYQFIAAFRKYGKK
jgi:hypothetical protein